MQLSDIGIQPRLAPDPLRARPGRGEPTAPGGRGRRRVATVAAGLLASATLLGTAALPASAAPAVQPVGERGLVPAMGLKIVDGAALHCPAGVTTWAPLVVPIEMGFPQGQPNANLDPDDLDNLADNSSLWYRDVLSLKNGTSVILNNQWTQDGGRSTLPVTRTGLLSGTYLMGAVCAKPAGATHHTFPLDANGNTIGEWFVLTFRWVDSQPEQSQFHFERQITPPGADPTDSAQPSTSSDPSSTASSSGSSQPSTTAQPSDSSQPATSQPAVTSQPVAEHAHDDDSDNAKWAWLVIVPVVLAAAVGFWLSRNRRRPT